MRRLVQYTTYIRCVSFKIYIEIPVQLLPSSCGRVVHVVTVGWLVGFSNSPQSSPVVLLLKEGNSESQVNASRPNPLCSTQSIIVEVSVRTNRGTDGP